MKKEQEEQSVRPEGVHEKMCLNQKGIAMDRIRRFPSSQHTHFMCGC